MQGKTAFLTGKKLKNEIHSLLSNATQAKLAVAYWGKDAFELLPKLKTRSNKFKLEVICCLKGGKSDPDIIKGLGDRARQIDNLHAKVFWTPDGAIVGSSNISSNGLPEEEDSSDGLIEAGVLVRNAEELDEIRDWFDTLWKQRGCLISSVDLAAAKAERELRKNRLSRKQSKKISLLDAMANEYLVGQLEANTQFLFYQDKLSPADKKRCKDYIKSNGKKIANLLGIKDPKVLQKFDFALDDPKIKYQSDTTFIWCHYENRKIKDIEVSKTIYSWEQDFPLPDTTPGEEEKITFFLKTKTINSIVELTDNDKDTIRKNAKSLWDKAKEFPGDKHSRLISVGAARKVLLGE